VSGASTDRDPHRLVLSVSKDEANRPPRPKAVASPPCA
jgi:hypothetical protein